MFALKDANSLGAEVAGTTKYEEGRIEARRYFLFDDKAVVITREDLEPCVTSCEVYTIKLDMLPDDPEAMRYLESLDVPENRNMIYVGTMPEGEMKKVIDKDSQIQMSYAAFATFREAIEWKAP